MKVAIVEVKTTNGTFIEVVSEDRKLDIMDIRQHIVFGAERNGEKLHANFAGGNGDCFFFHGLPLPDNLGFYLLDAKSYVELC